jgi:hypothetical protein
VTFPAPDVPATDFPSGRFWINFNGNREAYSRNVDDGLEASDGMACGGGFIDEFGRCTETHPAQPESL